ncbi:MAG TPA: tetratricopeptide repeat protein [Pyrinomonadaceae bacterium]|nr:tetratricopeptide repeat protein [Pyrinomonadaceae bacterium]
MRIFALFLLFIIALAPAFTQQTQTKKKPEKAAKKTAATPKAKPTPKRTASKPKGNVAAKAKATPKPTPKKPKLDESAEWEKCIALTDAAEAIASFKQFIANFPASKNMAEAQRRLSGSEAALADAHFELNEIEPALKLYAAAADDVPKPIPDTLFNERLSKVPAKLYWKGYRGQALDIARKLEDKADAPQLKELAGFYLTIESGDNARRAATSAIALAPDSAGYLMLALADRVDFDLDRSAAAYAKALELDPASIQAKRGLAEAYRSLGRSDEAATLYREILAADPTNLPAKTGVILSLFDGGKTADAEKELDAALADNPNNVMLLAGVAYWYSSHGQGEKAVDYGRRAVTVEPRFIWGHIALARGQMLQKMPLEAEKTLLSARRYGNFPTMDYELARARAAAGYYREAAEGIARNFTLKDGAVTTKLGGRVERSSADIGELISFERRASLFEPLSDADKESGKPLTALLEFWQAANSGNAEAAGSTAAAFESTGPDAMKLHREIFAASVLVDKKLASDAAIELLKNAAANSGTVMAAPDPTAAILADELYPARTAALARGETLAPSPVAAPTLSAIVRGRIEELAGAALAEKGETDEALIRYKRGLSVAPDGSVWQRSINWRIGTLLAAQNDLAGALPYFLKGYKGGPPDVAKYAIVKSAYAQVKGGLDGFEAEAGPDPLAKPETEVAKVEKPAAEPTPTPASVILGDLPPLPTETPTATPEPSPEPTAEASPTPATIVEAAPSASPTPSVTATPAATATELFPSVVIAIPDPKAAKSPSPTPTPEAAVEATPTPSASPTPEPTVEPTPTQTPTVEAVAEAAPTPSPTPEPTIVEPPTPTPTPEASPSPEPTVEATPAAEVTPIASPTPEPAVVEPPASTPTPSATPETTSTPEPSPTPSETPQPTVLADSRPRIARATAEGAEIKPCVITTSEIRMSMPVKEERGIIVGTEDDRDLTGLTAVSEGEKDLEVRAVPVAGIKSRSLYVIRSLTDKTGIYHVKFSLPCGSAELEVTVESPPK